MDNIVEIEGGTLEWLSEVLQRAVERGQTVRLHTATVGSGNDAGRTYLKVTRGGSMWTAPIFGKVSR